MRQPLETSSTTSAGAADCGFSIRSCALPRVHAVEARSGRVFPRHSHDEFGVGLIVRGAQRSWSGRGMVQAGPGSLITCNPGEVHDGAPIGAERIWTMLYLAPSVVAEIASDIRGGGSGEFEFHEPVVSHRPVASRFAATYQALTAGAEADRAHEGLILLLAHLLRCRSSLRAVVPTAIARAKARIDDDPVATVTLAELGREAGLSRYQLIRGFAKVTGLTPHAYMLQRRLAVARTRIAAGAALADAASACGFADQSHFSRTFTRRFGLTPGKYAAAMRRP